MTKQTCLFCDVYKKGDEIALETEYFYLRFDRFPISPGHAEIIPKRHVDSLLGLEAAEEEDFWAILKKAKAFIEAINKKRLYESLLKAPVNDSSKTLLEDVLRHVGISKAPDGYNFGVNDGEAAGRTVHHLHIHIIPRYFGDVEDPRGGVRHIIPEKGAY